MTKKKEKTLQNFVFEDIVITSAVVVGILGGGVMSICLKPAPIIIGIFLGMGISSLVYRFLGGIEKSNSLTFKGIKLTGTVAVWIACALIINSELKKQLNPEIPLHKNCILTVRKDMKLAQNIEVRVGEAEEIISPYVDKKRGKVEGKFLIPIKKLLDEGFIFISQKLDTQKDKNFTLKYNAVIPKITIFIEEE
jgi:hypothetical protein